MFVRFSCGCVGFPLTGVAPEALKQPRGADLAVILDPCDGDAHAPAWQITWSTRDMTGKTSAPLTEYQEVQLHARLGERLAMADRFEAVRSALGILPDRTPWSPMAT